MTPNLACFALWSLAEPLLLPGMATMKSALFNGALSSNSGGNPPPGRDTHSFESPPSAVAGLGWVGSCHLRLSA